VDAPADLIRLIADRRTVVGLTVGVLPTEGLTPFAEARARMPAILASFRRLHEAGALMVASSDAGIAPVKPHDAVRYAPAILRDIGFTPAEALRAVTSLPAEVLGLRTGRIAPGFDADILAIDGDPLADPAALHRIRAVCTRGTAVPQAGPSAA
jgi:imidazolonepropionase-like amidohydrolase